MYLSCIFAGKRQKGHSCAFSPHLASVYKIDFEGLNRHPVNDNTPGVYQSHRTVNKSLVHSWAKWGEKAQGCSLWRSPAKIQDKYIQQQQLYIGGLKYYMFSLQ